MNKDNIGIWQPEQTIYNCDDPPDFAYLIVSGIVELYSKKKSPTR